MALVAGAARRGLPRRSRFLCLAAPVLGLLLAFGAAPAWADDASDTAREIRELKARLNSLEKRLDAQSHENAVTRKAVAALPAAALPTMKGGCANPGALSRRQVLLQRHNDHSRRVLRTRRSVAPAQHGIGHRHPVRLDSVPQQLGRQYGGDALERAPEPPVADGRRQRQPRHQADRLRRIRLPRRGADRQLESVELVPAARPPPLCGRRRLGLSAST